MKKKWIIMMASFFVAVATIGVVIFVIAKKDDKGETPPPANNPAGLEKITGVTFDDVIKTYDGQKTTLVVEGTIPQGIDVIYTNNEGTNAGTYEATATLSGEGYETLVLEATLTINKATITGITFEGETKTYDGQKTTLLVAGTIPQGVNVDYTNNEGTNAGTYEATATLSSQNYETLVLEATLTINKATITGITFEGETKTYDGQKTTLLVEGTVPQGVDVDYTDNEGTNAGTYEAVATLSGQNYETLVLEATLTINKATITGITFEDETYSYDGTEKSLYIVGTPPAGSNIVYSCAESTSITNKATASGSYTITVTITHVNYQTISLTAVMTIEGSEEERHMVFVDGTLYFANALDKDKLYSYDGTELKKVSSDVPYNFTVLNDNVYYRSTSMFASSIKTIASEDASTIAAEKGEYLCTDGTHLYYAVNNAISSAKSGIFRLDLSGEEPVGVKLSEGKAKYLQIYDGYIYFADGSNGWKLSKVSVDGGTRTLVRDEKITCLTQSNGALYYTVNNLLGDYIEKYTISTNEYVKLTSDAGANLTVVGNTLYYINVDLLTSYLKGRGIYSISINPLVDNILPGKKVIGEDGEKYSSLVYTDGALAYYRVSDQMLCIYDLDSASTEEVLDGFIAPEVIPLSTGSKTHEYNGILYFLDLYNGKTLWSYNPKTEAFGRITSNKVSDFSILGDWLYYNAVSFGVNNDLYRVNLKLGGEPEKLSANDSNDIVTDGTNVFYVEQNAAGARTAIHILFADGTDEIIYDKGVNCLTYYDGYIYFEDGNDLLKMPTSGYTLNEAITVKKGNVDYFVISDGIVYFREKYGFLGASKRLSKVNVDGTGYEVLVGEDTDPIDIIVVGDTVYYYTDTMSGMSGIYSVGIEGGEPTLILDRAVGNTNTYFASELMVIDGKLYFINYYNLLGDSHLYQIDLTTKALTKIA